MRLHQILREGSRAIGAGGWALLAAASAALAGLSFYNFLLFHVLAEGFSITVCILLFVVAWQTHRFTHNNFLMYLANGCFWVAMLDLVHTITYKGMRIFPIDGANTATQFWLAARYVQALAFVTAPAFLIRPVPTIASFAGFGLLSAVLYAAIMSGHFPDAYVDGVGLTPFKIVSEYIIIAVLALAAGRLWARRALIDPVMLGMIALALTFGMLSEFAFTLYVNVYGLSNVLGHIIKLAAFWMIFSAVLRANLLKPYELLEATVSRLRLTQFAVDQAGDAVFWLTREGRFQYVNDAGCALLQRPREAILSGSVFDAGPPFTPKNWRAHLLALGKAGEVRIEIALTRANGEVVPTEISSNLLVFEDQRYIVAIVRDVSDRRKAVDALVRSNNELARFAAVASHDLQEPLRKILAYSHLFSQRRGAAFDEEEKKYLAFIVEGAARMRDMVRELQAYAQIGDRIGPFVRVDMNSLAALAIESLKGAIEETKAEITVGPLPEVAADAEQLTFVLRSLLGNAIKFRRTDVAPTVSLTARTLGGQHYFAVADNGIGIDAQHRDRVFDVFTRLHAHTRYPGAGMGLAACKRIVERHGGRIWVEAAAGPGSRFCFTLPAR